LFHALAHALKHLYLVQRHHEEKVHHVKSTSKTNARKQLDNSVPSTSGLLLADHKKLLRETSTPFFVSSESLLCSCGVEAGQISAVTAQASLFLPCCFLAEWRNRHT
jgi:hypothetical protein